MISLRRVQKFGLLNRKPTRCQLVSVVRPLQLPPSSDFGDSMLTDLHVTDEVENQDPIRLWKILS